MLKQLANHSILKVMTVATPEQIRNPNGQAYYYVSLPFYNHRVYKAESVLHSDKGNREFYINYWRNGKHSDGSRHKVIILQGTQGQIADRIHLVDGEWVEHFLGQ